MKQKQLRPKDPKKTFLRLFSYFKFNIILFFGGIFFIVIGSLAEIGINGMLSPVITLLSETMTMNYLLSIFLLWQRW